MILAIFCSSWATEGKRLIMYASLCMLSAKPMTQSDNNECLWWLYNGNVCLTGPMKLSCHTHCKSVWLIMDCNSAVCLQTDLLPLPAHASLAKLGLLIVTACHWTCGCCWENLCPKVTLQLPSYLATSTVEDCCLHWLTYHNYSALSTPFWQGKHLGNTLSW